MVSAVSSFQGNRYQVIRKLGEGGKGMVFLCQDTVLARRVAIKLIKEEVLDAEGLLRFQREVQAMASLVHPNVVTVFDLGQESGRHFLVLELMEGGDVEHLIAAATNQRVDCAAAIRIGQEVARALEHAHGHSILHRDIKPGNIWLTKTGQAKLGDFGLACLGSGPRLTRVGMMVGSVAYMAPEVALGKQADARSDLYMLGASLYEMITGRAPFPGDDPVRVLFSHINDLPLPPRRFAPEVPDGLESLILRLLSKDPEQRPASAAEVLRLLEEAEIPLHPPLQKVEAAPTLLSQRGARGDLPQTPEPRFAQPLVGRERELAFLRQRTDAALRGEGSLVFLTGEAGIGKTRLASEVRPYARGRGFLWLEGHYPKEGSTPFQPWVEAIRAFLRSASPSLLMKVLLPYGAELARLVPEVAERLGRLPAAPSIGPEEERLRLYEAISGFFTAIAREQPLVLFLDDLQWATSIDSLPHLARGAAPERLLLLATYRDIELEEKAALSETMQALNRERLFHSLPLKRLGEREVARLVAQTLGEEVSAKLGGLVYQKTEGNPYFVEEVVRYVTESGAITLGEQGWDVKDTSLLQLPRSVKAVVGKRLEQFEEADRGILAWASVVGREFSLPLLEAITGVEEEQLLEAVDKAVAARVLTPRPALGQEVYAFTDNQTRDVLYESIGPARRRRYHLKVGQAIETVHARHLEEHYDALAHHFLEGNALEKAAEYSLKAGERAASIYSWDRAIAHYQTALELLEEMETDPRQQAEVFFGLGRAQSALGRGVEGSANLLRAFDHFVLVGDVLQAVRVAQWPVPHLPGQLKEAPRLLSRALALVQPDSHETGHLLSLYGACVGLDQGDWQGAQQAFSQALEIAERENDSTLEMQTLARAGRINLYHLRLQECLDQSLRAMELARRLDDPSSEAESHYFAAVASWSMGDVAGARSHTENGLAVSERLRNRLALANLLWAAETIGRLTGDFRSARGFSDRGLALLPGDPRLLGTRALLEYEEGEFARGDVFYGRLLEQMRHTPSGASFEYAFAASVTGFAAHYTGDAARFDFNVAIAAARSVLASTTVTPLIAIRAQTGLALIAVEQQDVAMAREGYEMHTPRRGTMTPGGMGSVDHLLALLATVMEQPEVAVQHFEDALSFCRKAGYRPEYAHVSCDYADALVQRNGPADREKATALHDESLSIARELNMRSLMKKVLARRELLKA